MELKKPEVVWAIAGLVLAGLAAAVAFWPKGSNSSSSNTQQAAAPAPVSDPLLTAGQGGGVALPASGSTGDTTGGVLPALLSAVENPPAFSMPNVGSGCSSCQTGPAAQGTNAPAPAITTSAPLSNTGTGLLAGSLNMQIA